MGTVETMGIIRRRGRVRRIKKTNEMFHALQASRSNLLNSHLFFHLPGKAYEIHSHELRARRRRRGDGLEKMGLRGRGFKTEREREVKGSFVNGKGKD